MVDKSSYQSLTEKANGSATCDMPSCERVRCPFPGSLYKVLEANRINARGGKAKASIVTRNFTTAKGKWL